MRELMQSPGRVRGGRSWVIIDAPVSSPGLGCCMLGVLAQSCCHTWLAAVISLLFLTCRLLLLHSRDTPSPAAASIMRGNKASQFAGKALTGVQQSSQWVVASAAATSRVLCSVTGVETLNYNVHLSCSKSKYISSVNPNIPLPKLVLSFNTHTT